MANNNPDGDFPRGIDKRRWEFEEFDLQKAMSKKREEDESSRPKRPGRPRLKSTSPTNMVFACPDPGCAFAFTDQSFLLKHIGKSHNKLFLREKVPVVSSDVPSQQTGSHKGGTGLSEHKDSDEQRTRRLPHSFYRSLARAEEKREAARQKRGSSYVKKRLSCKQCSKTFNLLHRLKAHQREHKRRRVGAVEKASTDGNAPTVQPTPFQQTTSAGDGLRGDVSDPPQSLTETGEKREGAAAAAAAQNAGESLASPENGVEEDVSSPPIPERTSSEAPNVNVVFNCPAPGCTYSFTSRIYFAKHLKRSHDELYWKMVRDGTLSAHQEMPGPSTGPGGTDRAQNIGEQRGVDVGEKAPAVGYPQDLFSCNECQYAFTSEKLYHSHLKSSHYDLYRVCVLKQ